MSEMRRPARRYTPRRSTEAPAIVDQRLLHRRFRWLEVRLGCQHAGGREPLREPTLERVRREVARTDDPLKRLALMEKAVAEVFGVAFLRRVLSEHDGVLERERERRARS